MSRLATSAQASIRWPRTCMPVAKLIMPNIAAATMPRRAKATTISMKVMPRCRGLGVMGSVSVGAPEVDVVAGAVLKLAVASLAEEVELVTVGAGGLIEEGLVPTIHQSLGLV